MKKLFYSLFLLFLTLHPLQAQNSRVYADYVKTLQVIANEDVLQPPIINLGGNNVVDIGFDILSHDYHRLIYKVEHCNADWTPSTDIFESDYLEGFNGQVIEDVENSFNTNLLYTHYRIRIPNSDVSLKLSGNYKVHVYRDEEGADPDQPLLTACFSVVEPEVGISASVSSNTDIDFNKTHQQLSFSINYGTLTVNDPIRELKTVVMQNRRTDNWVINPKPDVQKVNTLEYLHNRQLIFDAGNEFHKFEILGFNRANMNVDQIQWYDPYYHVILNEDRPQKNYIFENDQNGVAVVRNEDNSDNETTSEYVWVHFTLKSPELSSGQLYIAGNWTYNQFTPEYRMSYNQKTQAYEASLLLKQGYYNYQYLLVAPGTTSGKSVIDGDFFQTENEYILLVYHRSPGERYDRLVGYRKMNYVGQ